MTALSFMAENLLNLGEPEIIEQIDYETLLTQQLDMLNGLIPLLFDSDYKPVFQDATYIEDGENSYWKVKADKDAGLKFVNLESEPMVMLQQVSAYLRMHDINRWNQIILGTMPAFAKGIYLENLAAIDEVYRLEITPADNTVNPAIPAVFEDDETFRRRWFIEREAKSKKGSQGFFVYYGLSADPRVKAIKATSPNPRGVLVTVLSREGDGTATQELLDIVETNIKANNEAQTDEITIQSADIVEYALEATITLYAGAPADTFDKIRTTFDDYRDKTEYFGHIVSDSGIKSALHNEWVYRAVINSPVLPIDITELQAAYCTGLTIIDGGLHDNV